MQAFGKVPGEASLYRKDLVGPLSRNYVNLFKEAGRQDCLNTSRFFLPSYSLRVENECNEFFRIFNSQAYEEEKQREKIVYNGLRIMTRDIRSWSQNRTGRWLVLHA